jgi:chromosomal replication initiation ATPase DnaA
MRAHNPEMAARLMDAQRAGQTLRAAAQSLGISHAWAREIVQEEVSWANIRRFKAGESAAALSPDRVRALLGKAESSAVLSQDRVQSLQVKSRSESPSLRLARLLREQAQLYERMDTLNRTIDQLRTQIARGDHIDPSILSVVTAVSIEFGVRQDVILGFSRTTPVTLARFACWAICRELLNCSSAYIGQAFRRDHGAILHGTQRVRDLVQQQPLFAAHLGSARERAGAALGIPSVVAPK